VICYFSCPQMLHARSVVGGMDRFVLIVYFNKTEIGPVKCTF
jgi:hypothetical protein